MDIYVLAFIIIFMLHNLEEILSIERWFKHIYPRIMDRVPAFAQKELKKFENITAAQFAMVVFLLSIVFAALFLIAVMTDQYFIFIGLNFLFAVNIFTHPLQALFLRSYVPGLWTALTLIIPYYILFFFHISKTEMLTLNTLLGTFVVMVLLIPVFLLSHKIGEKWS
jgi:hypothetical protein